MSTPANVERLRNLGARFQHRPGSHDIVTTCAACGGRLILHESEKWALCVGHGVRCGVHALDFDEVLQRIGAAGRAKP